MTSTTDREIEMSRIFDAPPEKVFEVWTKEEHLARWWGPNGFSLTSQSFEFRPGGVWRFVMHGPDGRDYDNLVRFREITPPERLVYDQGGELDGNPIQFQVTVTFAPEAGKTRLSMHSLFDSAAARDYVVEKYGAIEGGKQHLERLAAFLKETRNG